MKSVYFNHKRNGANILFMEYLDITELEYHNLYRVGKWTKSASDQGVEFYGDNKDENREKTVSGCGGFGGQGIHNGCGG